MSELTRKFRLALERAEQLGWSRNRIAEETGIKQSTLQRFIATPTRSLSLENAEKLMDFFSVSVGEFWVPLGITRNRSGRKETFVAGVPVGDALDTQLEVFRSKPEIFPLKRNRDETKADSPDSSGKTDS